MLLGEILHTGVIKTPIEAENKIEVIEEMVDLLVESHEISISMRDHIIEVVMEREKSMSTGMENGIALPHGASDRIDDVIAAMGTAPKGISFDCLDGQPAKIFVLMILPKNKFAAHVRTLAGIGHLLGNVALRDMLIKANDAETILDIIEEEEEKGLFDTYRAKE